MSTTEELINKKLCIGNNVKVYHLPSYTKFHLITRPDGSRIFNPSLLSKLCATLAVANTDPGDVQK
jgi:hypothetical protein